MNLFFKSALLLTTFNLVISFTTFGQNEALTKADSLFTIKKYTEAFQLYQQIFDDNHSSHAMLMKMAFIKEGLGDYTQALYYLNLFYQQTNDKKALTKMRELADEHHLIGYEYSDAKFIIGVLQKNKQLILLCLSALVLFLGAYMYRTKRKNQTPYTPAVLQLMTVLLIFILANDLFVNQHGIITRSNTLAMRGPSAGAEPIEIIEKGNKVVLLENNEIWSRIQWHGREVFVRSNSFKRI